MRHAFFEEFKISSFNFILLLFESLIRILTTINILDGEQNSPRYQKSKTKKGQKADPMHTVSKNYRRFLESRSKKIDEFIVHCIGWPHVLRSIEIIDMSIRDLVYKLIPATAVVKDLKTSAGKTIAPESKYTLFERKKEAKIGKQKTVDLVFELDLVTKPSEQEEEKKEDPEEKEKLRYPFYLNLADFSIFKLRSCVHLIDFPLTFTLAIMACWFRVIPDNPQRGDGFNQEEIDQILAIKQAIRDL